MAAATATSTSCGLLRLLGAIVLFVGFDLTHAQDNRFRINVYDNYQKQQSSPDYVDYQTDQNPNYQVDQGRDQNYHIGSDRNQQHHQNYQNDQRQVPNYHNDQRQVQNYQNDQRQVQNYQNDQRQVQNYPTDQRQVQNYEADRYQDDYRRRYQQQIEDRYKSDAVKPEVPKKNPKKDGQDFSKIPGVPGVDFPIFHTIPKTSFSCGQVPYLPGMYANVEAGCQVYHVCHDGREGDQGASFLCSNGTLFNQNEFACDWWYNVKCHDSFRLYSLNGDATTNPFVPKTKQDEILKGREINDKLKIVVF